jgi:hypothetical protein
MADITGVKHKLSSAANVRGLFSRNKPKAAKISAASAATTVQVEKPKVGAAEVPSSFKEVTPLIEPYAYAAITHDPATGGMLYYVIEPTLLNEDNALYKKLRTILVEELDVDVRKIPTKEEAQKLLRLKVESIVKQYRIHVEVEVLDKLMYFVTRDFIYHGKIEALMRDHMIEDISCDGPKVPIYIWHRRYESIPTNVIFDDPKELDNFVVKLAYLSGKHISIASPMVRILSVATPRDGGRQTTAATEAAVTTLLPVILQRVQPVAPAWLTTASDADRKSVV